ncbi:hypothetical protein GBF38_015208 [Nibea albiflora]|uniref:Uncharacterized protein n=1 Tax=Nibea albiflora TaxID=240163 RepID=A0ACB7EKQ3_NIBAL|nr:hypothetical protein GBF38_015208 [Nibea albiflora]
MRSDHLSKHCQDPPDQEKPVWAAFTEHGPSAHQYQERVISVLHHSKIIINQ